MAEKISQVGSGMSTLAMGGAILLAGFILVLMAVSAFIGQFLAADLAAWLAPLIVGVVVMLIGFAAFAGGRRNLKTDNLAPARTAESLRRDVHLAKEHLR
jgi:xanthine/uracil permease